MWLSGRNSPPMFQKFEVFELLLAFFFTGFAHVYSVPRAKIDKYSKITNWVKLHLDKHFDVMYPQGTQAGCSQKHSVEVCDKAQMGGGRGRGA